MLKNFFIILFSVVLVSCGHTSIKTKTTKINSEKSLKAPYVLLVSLDGYRHDYTKKYKPKFISSIANKKSGMKSLKAVFPTKTFPNHYSIVTGMYPDNHGIVANYFYAPDLKKNYALSDRNSVTNPDFYKGVPLWNLAVQQEMVSATLFWPGSEAPIGGYAPSIWEKYDHGMPHEKREKIILEWLNLPEKKRPHFITLYYHDVDSAGHRYGTESDEVKAAINKVDASLESLLTKVKAKGLPINVIILSDHGMTNLSKQRVIEIESLAKTEAEQKVLKSFKVVGYGPIVHMYYQGKPVDKYKDLLLTKKILNRHKKAKGYLRQEMPAELNFHKNIRNGDVIAVADMGWSIGQKGHRVGAATHGFAHKKKVNDMHGIFYAYGPNIKESTKVKAMENIHVYQLIADILGLNINHKIDGDNRLSKALLEKANGTN